MTETIHDLAYIIWWHHALNSLSHNLAQAAALSLAFDMGMAHQRCFEPDDDEPWSAWYPGCGRSAL